MSDVRVTTWSVHEVRRAESDIRYHLRRAWPSGLYAGEVQQLLAGGGSALARDDVANLLDGLAARVAIRRTHGENGAPYYSLPPVSEGLGAIEGLFGAPVTPPRPANTSDNRRELAESARRLDAMRQHRRRGDGPNAMPAPSMHTPVLREPSLDIPPPPAKPWRERRTWKQRVAGSASDDGVPLAIGILGTLLVLWSLGLIATGGGL